jgi:hypothetical protein
MAYEIDPGEQNPRAIAGKRRNDYTILSYKNTPGSMVNEITGKFITILGENTITINEDDLIEDTTLIDVIAILGTTVIYVPDNVMVEKHGDYLTGSIWIDKRIKNNMGIGQKRIMLFGEVVLGEIVIKSRQEKITMQQRIEKLKTSIVQEKDRMVDEIKRLMEK